MIFYGERRNACQSAAASAFSTARITRKFWSCACTPELLERQKLPKPLVGKDIWKQRFDDICAFERHLARNGTRILKFFLHVSKEEQRKRFLARIDEPAKRWKFSMADVAERKFWDKYQEAYEDMIRHTSQPEAPWFVVPADHKWFARMVVAGALVQELQALDRRFSEDRGQGAQGTAGGGQSAQGGKILSLFSHQIPGMRRKRVARQ